MAKVALLICFKYVGSTSTVHSIATDLMDLPLLFPWFTGPRRGEKQIKELALRALHLYTYMNVSGTMHWGQPPKPLADKPAELEYQQEH